MSMDIKKVQNLADLAEEDIIYDSPYQRRLSRCFGIQGTPCNQCTLIKR